MKEKLLNTLIVVLCCFNGVSMAAIPDFTASFTNAFERLDSETYTGGGGTPVSTYGITTLEGEYQAAGLTLTNTGASAVTYNIAINDPGATTFNFDIRRQVFVNTYYPDLGDIADALTLLPKTGSNWQVTIPANGVVKLSIESQIPLGASGLNQTTVDIYNAAVPAVTEQLSLDFNVLAPPAPDRSLYQYNAFVYPWLNVGQSNATEVASDLAAHGATMMEFPTMPTVFFWPSGDIDVIDYTTLDARLASYGPSVDRFMLFWESQYTQFNVTGGGTLTPHSPQWNNAFQNVVSAWLTHAASLGYGTDRFAILPYDEPSSSSFGTAPDQDITDFQNVSTLAKAANPNLDVLLTLTDYAGITDVNAMLPYVDIVQAISPYRTATLAGQPAGYNPRDNYYSTIFPALDAWRDSTGGDIWTYRISGGKSDNVLISHLAYPILAFAEGATGAGHWAYNVASGSTWDEPLLSTLDFSLIYDGTESHPLNLLYNVTGENVVPSIRWQALRAGLQNARILAFLKENKSLYNATNQTEIQDIFDEAVAMADDFKNSAWSNGPYSYWRHIDDYLDAGGLITFEYLADYSNRLRLLYEDVVINGDFNADGDIDGDDFLRWQRNFGMGGATIADGDANGDGFVDDNDLLIWETNFGSSGALVNQAAAISAVPEPSALSLVLLGCICLSLLLCHYGTLDRVCAVKRAYAVERARTDR